VDSLFPIKAFAIKTQPIKSSPTKKRTIALITIIFFDIIYQPVNFVFSLKAEFGKAVSMKILVMSDTHGNTQLALQACRQTSPFDAIIHLGDGYADAELLAESLDVKVIQVAGNCDIGSNLPRERIWECEGKRILLVHGDAYSVKSGLEKLTSRAVETGVDAVLFGHTHWATITTLSEILFVNPGTLMHLTKHTSFAVLEIDQASIKAELFNIQ
jgi:putative phosphoesterase